MDCPTSGPSAPGPLVAGDRFTPDNLLNILGVVYLHQRTADGGDLYLTRFGAAHMRLLQPEHWFAPDWFTAHRERLEGTSSVYRLPTREVDGQRLELVVKNCRVGEDVPLTTHTLREFLDAEFNSPWEEFALVQDLREGAFGPRELRIPTQEPLAIYVPPEEMQLWQSGRSQEKISRICARHPGIALDILRQYKLVYGWIPGRDVVQILTSLGWAGSELAGHLQRLTAAAIADLAAKGFAVADMKPAHIIIGTAELAGVAAASDRQAATEVVHGLVAAHRYSVIDYELLLRTQEYESQVKHQRRYRYLDDQRQRFTPTEVPAHLEAVEVLGVPYIRGHVESTGGELWVVGCNARLFDYFLPERWRRTPNLRLSTAAEVYYTLTKDAIHLVWKTSRVGERPDPSPQDPRAARLVDRGFNSPFEEVALAHRLQAAGVPTVYLRAIYRTGSAKAEPCSDPRRFQSLRDPAGRPWLDDHHNYITIRGWFNGPDAWVAAQAPQAGLCRPLDLDRAVAGGYLPAGQAEELRQALIARLAALGCDGSLLQANDLLVAFDPQGRLLAGPDDQPELRICNLDFLAWD